MRHPRCTVVVSLSLTLAAAVDAQVVLSNSITGSNPGSANPFATGQTIATGLTSSGIGRGTGITAASAADRYSASGWNSSALNTSDYFSWTLTPAFGNSLALTGLTYTGQASATGPTTFALRSSLDSFTGNIGTPTSTGGTITLTSGMFDGLTNSVEFRLYAWGASSGTGTFSVNDFTFNGSLSAVPEPSTYAAMAGLAGLALAAWRRRRAHGRSPESEVGERKPTGEA